MTGYLTTVGILRRRRASSKKARQHRIMMLGEPVVGGVRTPAGEVLRLRGYLARQQACARFRRASSWRQTGEWACNAHHGWRFGTDGICSAS